MPNSIDSHSSPYSVLLVDDNQHGLVARSHVLTGLGYRVQIARCAEEALEIMGVQGVFFHVLVTDFKMLGLNGVQLIEHVKASSPRTKTVLLSGFVEPLALTEASTGADAVLMKSNVELEQLTRTLKRLLAGKVSRKPAASEKCAPVFMVNRG